ncbi:phage tail protein [Paenibacillus sp.]|uniref:phage tail protein n=1 Tax=Paenibacillus sp. TaxID=58172 RepID=UPI0028125771|nr:phage tail protein [Paenibacillus sp.]
MRTSANRAIHLPEGTDNVDIDIISGSMEGLDAAFGTGASGHTHDGTPGNGPKITASGLGSGAATDTVIGNRTADPDTATAYGLTGSVTQLFSWILKYFKAITGKASPFDAPATTLEAAKTHMDSTAPHSATSAPTASRLVIRDASGRAQVAAPAAAADIARKDTVDAVQANLDAHIGAGGGVHANAVAGGAAGFMTGADKSKLDAIAAGAEVNQNAFSTITVSGQTSVAADSKSDTLTLAAGTGVDITTNSTTDTVTIAGKAASTSQAGVVQLNTATNSTSTSQAATPSAVKAAYDLAAGKVAKAGDTMTGNLTVPRTVITDAMTFEKGRTNQASVYWNASPSVDFGVNVDIEGTTALTIQKGNLIPNGNISIPPGADAPNAWSNPLRFTSRNGSNQAVERFIQSTETGQPVWTVPGITNHVIWHQGNDSDLVRSYRKNTLALSTPEVNNAFWGQTALEIKTQDGSRPGLTLHREGHFALALYLDTDGQLKTVDSNGTVKGVGGVKSVQRGSVLNSGGTYDIPINSVDVNKSYLITNAGGTSNNGTSYWKAELLNATTVRITIQATAGATVHVAWQVVESY